MSMFCYQCEQTARGTGCTVAGVCGKNDATANLQDLLVQVTKEIAFAVDRAGQKGVRDASTDEFILGALFATVTNVNFDEDSIIALICRAKKMLESIMASADCSVQLSSGACETREAMLQQAERFSHRKRLQDFVPTVAGLQDLVLFGLKGAAAYAHHALALGQRDDQLMAEFARTLAILYDNPTDVDTLLAEALRVGKINLRAMELLNAANTGTYGKPEPTSVRITPIKGKCILVSGHDLRDLAELLAQTEGKGINVYTHCEMLPTHAYPKLKACPPLAGNFGGAWQDQAKEFSDFPGPVLMTTNCIQRPGESYINRIFTTGLVEFPGVKHIPSSEIGTKDFSPIIEAALASPGFADDVLPEQRITVGFGADAVLGVADKVIEAVKAGKIRRFFLVGGCDGAKPGRNYYTELAQKIPNDCVILTLACGKFRFNKLDFGDIDGIPRLLDVGQCNDAYSAIRIATALAEAFRCSVNELPLSMILSWYEQKAIAILLTLLSLGIQGIRLGPSLPAFVSPEVLEVLVNQFSIKPITTPDDDLQAILS